MHTGLRPLLAVLVMACGSSSSGPHGTPDDAAPPDDAEADASDAPATSDDDGGPPFDATGPYPSDDAPEYGPDGCLLISISCTDDTMCCSGWCNQGECGTHTHPESVPGR